MPLLKLLISKSLASSNHVKIVLWVKLNNKPWVKRLFLVQKFLDRGFSLISALLLLPLLAARSTRFFLKEKSDLVDIMIGLIKNLKKKCNLQVYYLCCNNAGENIAFEKPTNRKGWGVALNIQPMVSHNRMAMLKENLLPFSTGYGICSMAGNAMLIYEMAYGPKMQTSPHFLRTIFYLMQKFGEMCIITYRDNTLG